MVARDACQLSKDSFSSEVVASCPHPTNHFCQSFDMGLRCMKDDPYCLML